MLFPLYDLNPHRRFPWLTLVVIAINVVVMARMTGLNDRAQSRIALNYGFVPARLTHVGQGKPIAAPVMELDRPKRELVNVGVAMLSTSPADVYPTLITTMFLHGGWWHLLSNMWMLWIFGNNVEDRLGHVMFLVYYLAGGIIATLCHWAFAAGPNNLVPVVGASGAVAAVLGGYAVTYPTAKVRTLVFIILITIIDIPAVVWLGIWFVSQLASGLMGLMQLPVAPVAFWAHAGGFVAGMILMPLMTLGASPPGTDWRQESDELFQFDDPRRGPQ
jgi:membrane associated rhomboid family serine protease